MTSLTNNPPQTLSDSDFLNTPPALTDAAFSSPQQQSPSESVWNNVFRSPLQNFAQGNGQNNIDVAKGFAKGALQTFSSAGSQNNPVGRVSLENAPVLKSAIGALEQKLQPANEAQTFGLGSERVAEFAIPVGTGVTALKAAPTAAKDSEAILNMLTPKMTARETAQAVASRGGTKSGVLGNIKLNPDPAVKRIADTVSQYVPDFSPKKSLVENINAVRTATDNVAQQLKSDVVASGQDRIYPFKELKSILNNLPKPTLLVGDMEKVYGRVVEKATEIARNNGGRISDLFQARKEFDDFVRREFPNLYSSDTLTPMRSAIKNVRNAMTDFTAEHLPEDINLHDKLKIQNHLLDAIENMASKAKGEIGTNIIERATKAAKAHPLLSGLGAAAAYEVAKKTPIIGDILP